MGKLSRRGFLKVAALTGGSLAGVSILAACGGTAATPAATETATSAATETATATATETATAAATETATATATETATATAASTEPIKIGALVPMTGAAAWAGAMMRDCTQLAINEINAAGGVLGKQIEMVLEDDESNPEKAVPKARRLIQETKVAMINGTLFSSVRNAVKEQTEAGKMIFLNPTYYEGGQCGKYYFSTGAVPNQQFAEYVPWLIQNVGKKFYLVGSDYAWPRGSFAGMKPILQQAGGTVVGEDYVPLGNTEWTSLVRKIGDSGAEILFQLVAGSDGAAFMAQVTDFGLNDKMAMAFSGVSESFTATLAPQVRDKLYVYVDYLMGIDTPENAKFLDDYRKLVNDPKALLEMIPEHQYENTHLWALAANKAGSLDPDAVGKALTEVTFKGPAGPVSFDPSNHHATLTCYIAQCNADNQYKVLKVVPGQKPDAGCTLS